MPHVNKTAPGKVAFPEELKSRLKSFITERCGLYFRDHDLKGLEDALIERIRSRGMDSAVTYYSYITNPEHREDELRELLNKLTITHTYFFRNEPQFKALRERILPEIVERKSARHKTQATSEKPSIRIWSAGCSTGEEPYSIAMTVMDVIPDIENWDIEILATDASTEALDRARRGVYGKSSVKPVDTDHMEKYFTVKDKEDPGAVCAINSEVKKLVTFGFHNLMADDFPGGFDIILFRNVAIYFDLETTIKILEKMHSGLNDGGYLLIGYSESLYFMQDKFRMIDWEEAIYYRKAFPGEGRRFETAVPSADKGRTVDEVLEEISRAERTAALDAEVEKIKIPQKNIEELLVRATKLYHMKDYAKAVSVLDEAISANKDSVDPYYLKAEIYVNMGKFFEAKASLAKALAKDRMFAPAHYLLGCISIEESLFDTAKESLKRAIYIDKSFPLAHFYLAHAYRSEGKVTDAIREYRNAIKLLSNAKSDDILPYGGGFEAATFIGACRDNIERLKMEN